MGGMYCIVGRANQALASLTEACIPHQQAAVCCSGGGSIMAIAWPEPMMFSLAMKGLLDSKTFFTHFCCHWLGAVCRRVVSSLLPCMDEDRQCFYLFGGNPSQRYARLQASSQMYPVANSSPFLLGAHFCVVVVEVGLQHRSGLHQRRSNIPARRSPA